MSSPGDPGRSVNVRADVAFLGQERRARVQPHPHLDRSGGQRLRECPGSDKRTIGRREREEKGVALRIHFNASLSSARLANDPAMPGERLRIGVGAQPIEQPRGSLYVSEEKGHRPARKILAHAAGSSACRSIASSPPPRTAKTICSRPRPAPPERHEPPGPVPSVATASDKRSPSPVTAPASRRSRRCSARVGRVGEAELVEPKVSQSVEELRNLGSAELAPADVARPSVTMKSCAP